MKYPARVVDLHVHVFNARCVPLAAILKRVLGVKSSALVDIVAWILVRLSGSTFGDEHIGRVVQAAEVRTGDATAIRLICDILVNEMQRAMPARLGQGRVQEAELSRWLDSDLLAKLVELSELDYTAERRVARRMAKSASPRSLTDRDLPPTQREVSEWGRATLRRGLEELTARMPRTGTTEPGSYLEFILTMLRSEDAIYRQFVRSMGSGFGTLTTVHYMMDMQMAYTGNPSPYYPFHPTQRDRMLQLHARHAPALLGFSAFDPRRDNWLEMMRSAKNEGFLGFKFYPAMGFAPSGNKPPLQARIDAFYDECIDLRSDTPIFAHCTPKGFEPSDKAGLLADPRLWGKVLETRPKLRLCLGHAGGGYVDNKSMGWMARDQQEWDEKGDFAREVVRLCTTYENVYCEVGNLTQMLSADGRARFLANLQRAYAIQGNYSFLRKIAYGSDWHMPDMISGPRKYLDTFVALFDSDPVLKPHLDDFFWRNALDYLRMPY